MIQTRTRIHGLSREEDLRQHEFVVDTLSQKISQGRGWPWKRQVSENGTTKASTNRRTGGNLLDTYDRRTQSLRTTSYSGH